jgi:hypothetical protein
VKRIAIIAAAGLAMAAAADPVAQWFHFGDAAAPEPSTPYLAESLSAMWTFNSADWTNANYGAGSLARESGFAIQGDGVVTLTGKTSYAISPLSMAPTNTGTIAMRVSSTTNVSSYLSYIAGGAFAQNDMRVRYITTGHEWAAWSASAAQWQTTVAYPLDQYATLIWTWTTDDMRVYRLAEGASVVTQIMADASCSITWTATVARVWGAQAAGGSGWFGPCDEIRIYNRVVSSNEAVGIAFDMPWGL